jgi:hypothetical protein
VTSQMSVFKPNGWHLMDGLDARIYRAAQAIDGVTDILQPRLTDDMPKELRGAIFASCDLLARIRDELFHVANMHIACEDEGV